MSITIKNIKVPGEGIHGITVDYLVKAPSGTPDKPTTVESEIQMTLNDNGAVIEASLLFAEASAHSIEETFEKLARWAADTAVELRNAKTTLAIPLKLK